MSPLSEFLVKQRRDLGLTQAEIARKIEISPDAVTKHESAKRRPKIEYLLKYSRLYHVSIYKLIDLEIEDIKEAEHDD